MGVRNVRLASRLAPATLAVVSIGCADTSSLLTPAGTASRATATAGATPGKPARLVIASGSTTKLYVGQIRRFGARAWDSAGVEVSSFAAAWSVTPYAVARIWGDAKNGAIWAVGAGSMTLSVTSNGAQATASVLVVRDSSKTAPVSAVSASSTVQLKTASTWQLAPIAVGREGQTLFGRTFTYTSSNPSVATVSSTGLIRAIGIGTAVVTASCGGKSFATGVIVDGGTAATAEVATSVAFNASKLTLAMGTESKLTLTVKRADGAELTTRPVLWNTSFAGIASVSADGVVRALNPGTVNITATVDGKTAVVAVVVPEPTDSTTLETLSTSDSAKSNPAVPTNLTPAPTPVAPAPTATAMSLPLTVYRLDGQTSGAVTISNGIPLPPGALTEARVGNVRVTVAGTEVPVYVEALSGQHKDGSLRSVLVQFTLDRSDWATVPVRFEIATGLRSATALAKTAVTWNDLPPAVAFPADPSYLVSTQVLMVPTLPLAEVVQTSTIKKYEDDFKKWSKTYAAQNPDPRWNESADYDMGYNHFAYWVRTGDFWYWQRAARIEKAFRDDYLKPNKNQPAEWHANAEGLAVHYWLTGDERSKAAVEGMSDFYAWLGIPSTQRKSGKYTSIMYGTEGRRVARILSTNLAAQMLNPASPEYALRLRAFMAMMPGRLDAQGLAPYAGTCMGQKAFMEALVHSAMTKYYDNFEADPRILSYFKKTLDFMWESSWQAKTPGFSYITAPDSTTGGWKGCETEGTGGSHNAYTGSINHMNVHAYAWYYAQTHDVTYLERAGQIFDAGTKGTYYNMSKNFAQGFFDSWTYFYYRSR
jgi:uncharacterized protein YjdB